MKIALLGMFVAVTSISMAQTTDAAGRPLTPETRAQMHTDRMIKDLGLTPKQAEQVRPLNLDVAQKMEEHKAQTDKDKAAMQAYYKEMEAKYAAVLTPEQMTKMKELEKQRMEKRQALRQPQPAVMKKTELQIQPAPATNGTSTTTKSTAAE